MFMVCGRTSFYVVDKEDGFTNVKTAGTKRSKTDVQDLVYKTYKWMLDNIDSLLDTDFVNKFIEIGISVYKLDIPELSINLARCESYSEQLFEYINLKFNLFGYVYVKPEVAVC